MNPISRTITILQLLLKREKYGAMVNRIESLEVPLSTDVRLLRLYGVALGMMGEHLRARMAFSEAFEVSDDTTDLANAITSLFADGDIKTAVHIIEEAFTILSPAAVEIVAHSAIEAVRIRAVDFEALPVSLRNYLGNVGVIVT